jgi:hypothetical protein
MDSSSLGVVIWTDVSLIDFCTGSSLEFAKNEHKLLRVWLQSAYLKTWYGSAIPWLFFGPALTL